MIKRADGSYSQRGLWDNIRANRGSGKKPTSAMLKQERKIKAKMEEGGVNNPGFRALPGYVQAKIRSNMQEGGMTGSPMLDIMNNQRQMPMMQMGGSMPQTSLGQSVLQEAMMNKMQSGGEYNRMFNKANRKDAPVVLNPKNKNQYYLNKQMDTDMSYRAHQQMLNQDLGKPYIDELGNEVGNTSSEMDRKVEEAYKVSNLIKKIENTPKNKLKSSSQSMFNPFNRTDAPAPLTGKNKDQYYLNQRMFSNMSNVEQQQMLNQNLGKDFTSEFAGYNSDIDGINTKVNEADKVSETIKKLNLTKKMQTGGYKPSIRIGDRGNYSGSDNTMAPNPAMMQQRVAEGQALIKQTSTPQGRAQMAAGKQRAETNIAASNAKKAQQAAQAKAKQVADMKARIADSNKVQDMSMSDQFKPENIERATQATGDKLRLFGPSSPLVTSGLFEADPSSFVDNYLNPAKFVGDMATNLGQGINETAKTGDFTAVGKALATPLVAGATMGYLKSPMHSLEKQASKYLTSGVNSAALGTAFANPAMATGLGIGASLIGKGISRSAKTAGQAAEHDIVHRTTAPTMIAGYKSGGTIKDMYYMKNGGQFPERYKKMGFSGVDKPKKTTSGGKSHAVVTKVDGNYKLIRFGQQGVSGSPDGSARNKAFKSRHAKNIAKGKSSAAYWSNKIKW